MIVLDHSNEESTSLEVIGRPSLSDTFLNMIHAQRARRYCRCARYAVPAPKKARETKNPSVSARAPSKHYRRGPLARLRNQVDGTGNNWRQRGSSGIQCT